MAQQRGPQFQFYQAPPGPDASRQYSDWTQAILAQGDAISKPLLLLMQNIAAKQGQEREIAARNAERQDTLQYDRTRDATHDQQWQKDYALKQSEQFDRTQQEQYRRAQDTAGLDMTIASMDPGNSVQKPDPMLDRLVQMRNGMQPVPFSPMPQVAPRNEFLDTFLQTHMRNQERQQEQAAKQQVLQTSLQNTNALIDNAAANKTITPAQATAFKMRLDPNDEVGVRGVGTEIQKIIGDAATLEGGNAAYDSASKALQKSVKTDFPNDHDKQGQVAATLALLDHSPMKPDEKMKLLADRQKEIYGIGKTASSEPSEYLPGIGMVKFNTPLGKGGEYTVDAQGNPILPQNIDAELTALAQKAATERFKPVMGTDITPPEERAAFVKQAKQSILDQRGWQRAGASDPIGAMDPFAGSQAPQGGTEAAPVANSAPTSQSAGQPQQPASNPLAGHPPEVLQAAMEARAGGPSAVRAVLAKAADEASKVTVNIPPSMDSAWGREFLKQNPEPQWWWSYNSGYAPKLKDFGGSVEKAHAAWMAKWRKDTGRGGR